MNKTAIKNFAVWARQKLISDITYKAGMLGITENGIAEKLPQSTDNLHFYDIGTKNYAEVSGKEISQRSALVSAIRNKERTTNSYKEAFRYIVEEVAYTWFNRLIAIRFMEVNDYLPSRIRVLSSENSAKTEPDFVTTPFDTDLEFKPSEQDRIIQLKDENKLDELFRMLFIRQCNKLHDILPELFEKTDDYTELLLTISFTDKDGVVYRLTHDIDEDDFNVEKEGQVEIIGWLYQYYNTEPKDTVFANLKKNIKISKDNIPAATQLFTPGWIVRYMVENSLGRLWLEGHKNDSLKSKWQYYLDETEQEADVQKQLDKIRNEYKNITPEEIKVMDPCMGSGHILVYAFDVLMQIYESYGYTQRDASRSILENNLYGLDIDKRAYQLAYFAVMMKARQYNRRILTEGIKTNLFVIKESNKISKELIEFIANGDANIEKNLTAICDELYDATEYGSILNITSVNFEWIYNRIDEIEDNFYDDIFDRGYQIETSSIVLPIIKQAQTMAQKYDVVITNPPYMGGNYSPKLSNYLKKYYGDTKTDFFSVFMEKCMQLTNDYVSMVTPESWMFLYTYLGLRNRYIRNMHCVNCAHLGMRAFECGFGTTAFIFTKKRIEQYKSKFVRLTDFSMEEKQYNLTKAENEYLCSSELFRLLPNEIMSYWCSLSFAKELSEAKPFGEYYELNPGIKTGNNELFLRLWQEVNYQKISYSPTRIDLKSGKHKWYFYNKGGGYRKWYGGYEYVVDFECDAQSIKNLISKDTYRLRNPENYFIKGILWPLIGSDKFSSRYLPLNVLSDIASNTIYFKGEFHYEAMAFMNCSVFNMILNMINPTVSYPIDSIYKVPYKLNNNPKLKSLTMENISFARYDWDSFETSWDFTKHPLLCFAPNNSMSEAPMNYTISSAFDAWNAVCENRFNQLKANEEELNRIFIEIYGLQDELTPEVEDKDVTVRKADLQRDIKSLLSYAVGCMFGRYSLDSEGLAYAGVDWDNSKYETFIPDDDNCIPITDEEYFEDDIVGLFCKWLEKVYGKDTLEENLDFIANALGNKGKTSREVIRNYFLNDFIKDHIKIYQKRPIYWMFDSGKQNGFKALCYMHRWNSDTIGNMRVDYLHRIQRVYEKEFERMQEITLNSKDRKEVASANKRKEKLQKQIKETKEYDTKVAHLALSRIDIDLDDGVKVNYEKVQTAPDGKKMQILTKI